MLWVITIRVIFPLISGRRPLKMPAKGFVLLELVDMSVAAYPCCLAWYVLCKTISFAVCSVLLGFLLRNI